MILLASPCCVKALLTRIPAVPIASMVSRHGSIMMVLVDQSVIIIMALKSSDSGSPVMKSDVMTLNGCLGTFVDVAALL